MTQRKDERGVSEKRPYSTAYSRNQGRFPGTTADEIRDALVLIGWVGERRQRRLHEAVRGVLT